jgi:hypothetical protein
MEHDSVRFEVFLALVLSFAGLSMLMSAAHLAH